MKVELLSCTQDALELLLYTKNTRLQGAQSLQDIKDWPDEEKQKHFKYMLDTIQSSFEFVEYTFKISEVPRSFTHQLVRTRTGSYAQESQRTVDVRDHGCEYPEQASELIRRVFGEYAELIDNGVAVQEAREILPTGAHTSIIAKFDLRTLHNMALVRLCTRTAGMYQNVFKEIKRLVVEEHPWAEDFIQVHCSWYGTCAFPRYTECPIYPYTINGHAPEVLDHSKKHCRKKIETLHHVANPIAKDGMSMAGVEKSDLEALKDKHVALGVPREFIDCDHCELKFKIGDCPKVAPHKVVPFDANICKKFEWDHIPF